jgi:hypothetical protein
MLEVRLSLDAAFEDFEGRNDMLQENSRAKGMHVLHVHDSLVDLLTCTNIRRLKLLLILIEERVF